METMPSAGTGFQVIEKYRNLAKHLDVEHEAPTCKDMMSLDQEVPQTRSYLEDGDFYSSDVKMEAIESVSSDADLYTFMNMDMLDDKSSVIISSAAAISNHNSIIINNSTSNNINNNIINSSISNSINNNIINSNIHSSLESRIPTMASVHQSDFPNFLATSVNSYSPSSSLPSTLSLPTELQHSMISSTSPLSPPIQSSPSPMLSSTVFSSSQSSLPLPTPSSHIDISRNTSSSSLPSSAPAGTASIPVVSNHPAASSNVKVSSYVSSLGGSGGGCVVMTPAQSEATDLLTGEIFTLVSSTPNFLTNTSPSLGVASSSPPSLGVPEGNLNYLDLDKQPSSFYDEMKFSCEPVKPAMDNSLEEMALMMRDIVHQDCDSLKVPYDPMYWSPHHVRTWLSWVCQKNSLTDVSAAAVPMDGRSLCALKPNELVSHYGSAGESISTELELWKAANSYFPESQTQSQYSTSVPTTVNKAAAMQMSMPQIHNLLDSEPLAHQLPYTVTNSGGRRSTPCVSPAPSSSSQDSNQGGAMMLEGSSDNSDDEYSPNPNLSYTGSNKVGRGHKQTIHLWQFLRELLISKENHTDCIRWLDHKAGIFKIEDSKKVAYLWGQRKNRPAMNYDKLSRSVRQYYKKKIIKKTEQSKRLVYQFCPGYL